MSKRVPIHVGDRLLQVNGKQTSKDQKANEFFGDCVVIEGLVLVNFCASFNLGDILCPQLHKAALIDISSTTPVCSFCQAKGTPLVMKAKLGQQKPAGQTTGSLANMLAYHCRLCNSTLCLKCAGKGLTQPCLTVVVVQIPSNLSNLTDISLPQLHAQCPLLWKMFAKFMLRAPQ